MLALLLAMMALAGEPPASPAPADSDAAKPATTVQGITVTGHALPDRKKIDRFVGALNRASAGRGSLPRWPSNLAVCPQVLGVTPAAAQAWTMRLQEIAASVHLKVGRAGCEPNLQVIVAPHPEQAFAKMADAMEREELDARNSPADLRRFMARRDPVRWWRTVRLAPADGGLNAGYDQEVTTFRNDSSASRLQLGSRQVVSGVVVLVDADQAKGASAKALIDYVAFGALAPIDTSQALGDPKTVLTLFDDLSASQAPPSGLTKCDEAFLKALYTVSPDQTSGVQETEMARLMSNPRSASDAVCQ
jgi:hypothetical protein